VSLGHRYWIKTFPSTDIDTPFANLRITGVSNALNGTAVLNDNGTVGNFSDDFITFDPTKGFTGNTTFNYTVSDGSLTSTTTVTVDVGATFGTPGADTLTTGNGADTIYAFGGDDTVNSGSGNDFVDGGDGNDNINGGIGDDILLGGNGNDVLVGDNGSDFLRGGFGNDILTGGNASDTFVLAAGEGKDTITDFQASVDLIGLAGGLTFGQLSFSGNDIIRTSTNEILATLTGVNTNTLTAANFVTV
jgi:Ca2+-binding RTX toxin-like protein